jgi:hypothetical protein
VAGDAGQRVAIGVSPSNEVVREPKLDRADGVKSVQLLLREFDVDRAEAIDELLVVSSANDGDDHPWRWARSHAIAT